MIFGIGTDIIQVERVKKSIETIPGFTEKIFSPFEIDYCQTKKNKYEHFAARFAAKEAFFKALGTGMRTPHSWHDIIILNDTLGKPMISLAGKSAQQLKNAACHVSLSHTEDYATAVVIIEN